MSNRLNLLLVEDSDADALLVSAELNRHGYELKLARVQTEPDFLARLAAGSWDVIIADYRLPRFSALRALELVRQKQLELPFIIVSGTIGEEVAVAAMKAGAHDYVMKDKLARLVPVVERELRDAEVRRARARAEKESKFQARLLQAVGQAVVATDADGKITYWNRPAELLYGWPAGEAMGRELAALILPSEAPSARPWPQQLDQGRPWFGEMLLRHRNGSLLTALVTHAPVVDADQNSLGMIQVSTDLTDRKQAELQLQNSREQLRALAAKLESVREEERKSLSRDIHDELGQVLTGLKMELAWMRSRLSSAKTVPREALLEKIAQLGEQIDASATTIRKLCAELRPGILDDLGLEAAIDWQAREFSKRTGIKCQLTARTNNLQLGPDSCTAVFRIFQEILTNIARHAKAANMTVVLTETEVDLVLEAQDDGRGIRPEEVTGDKSLGLLGMRERAMALGGNIEFLGLRQGGTSVRLRVPLDKRAPGLAAQPNPAVPVPKPRGGRR